MTVVAAKPTELKPVHCKKCDRVLCYAKPGSVIQITCKRCKADNTLKVS